MAFSATTFQTIGHGNGQSVHLYKSADLLATVVASGYFNTMAERLNRDDVIIAVTGAGGTDLVDVLVVTSATGASPVTVTNGT